MTSDTDMITVTDLLGMACVTMDKWTAAYALNYMTGHTALELLRLPRLTKMDRILIVFESGVLSRDSCHDVVDHATSHLGLRTSTSRLLTPSDRLCDAASQAGDVMRDYVLGRGEVDDTKNTVVERAIHRLECLLLARAMGTAVSNFFFNCGVGVE